MQHLLCARECAGCSLPTNVMLTGMRLAELMLFASHRQEIGAQRGTGTCPRAHGDHVRELGRFNPCPYLPVKGSFQQSTLTADSQSIIRMCVPVGLYPYISVCACTCICADVPHTQSVINNMPVHRRRVSHLLIWAPTVLCDSSLCCHYFLH